MKLPLKYTETMKALLGTKAIFQQHSFRFGVQSTVGKGTTFWFVMSDLPYVDDFEGK